MSKAFFQKTRFLEFSKFETQIYKNSGTIFEFTHRKYRVTFLKLTHKTFAEDLAQEIDIYVKSQQMMNLKIYRFYSRTYRYNTGVLEIMIESESQICMLMG